MTDKRILVLGVGNILLGDEGFGIYALHWLNDNYSWPDNVTLVDGGTRGLLLMGELMESDLVVILDIATGESAPGTFYYLTDKDWDEKLWIRESMHQTGVNDILISCELAGHRPEAIGYCMEPFDWHTVRASLSSRAEDLLPLFCEKVVEELAKLGIIAKKLL